MIRASVVLDDGVEVRGLLSRARVDTLLLWSLGLPDAMRPRVGLCPSPSLSGNRSFPPKIPRFGNPSSARRPARISAARRNARNLRSAMYAGELSVTKPRDFWRWSVCWAACRMTRVPAALRGGVGCERLIGSVAMDEARPLKLPTPLRATGCPGRRPAAREAGCAVGRDPTHGNGRRRPPRCPRR